MLNGLQAGRLLSRGFTFSNASIISCGFGYTDIFYADFRLEVLILIF